MFDDPDDGAEPLADLALARYRYFVGELWTRYGEAAWLGPWRMVHGRAGGAPRNIVAELRGIQDPDAARSVPMLIDDRDDAAPARAALAAVYDAPWIDEVMVFNVGDGAAMSGLLIAARAPGRVISLVFLLD